WLFATNRHRLERGRAPFTAYSTERRGTRSHRAGPCSAAARARGVPPKRGGKRCSRAAASQAARAASFALHGYAWQKRRARRAPLGALDSADSQPVEETQLSGSALVSGSRKF